MPRKVTRLRRERVEKNVIDSILTPYGPGGEENIDVGSPAKLGNKRPVFCEECQITYSVHGETQLVDETAEPSGFIVYNGPFRPQGWVCLDCRTLFYWVAPGQPGAKRSNKGGGDVQTLGHGTLLIVLCINAFYECALTCRAHQPRPVSQQWVMASVLAHPTSRMLAMA